MRVREMRLAHWLDERLLRHRIRAVCRYLWCWHVMCEGGVTSRCRYCGRGDALGGM